MFWRFKCGNKDDETGLVKDYVTYVVSFLVLNTRQLVWDTLRIYRKDFFFRASKSPRIFLCNFLHVSHFDDEKPAFTDVLSSSTSFSRFWRVLSCSKGHFLMWLPTSRVHYPWDWDTARDTFPLSDKNDTSHHPRNDCCQDRSENRNKKQIDKRSYNLTFILIYNWIFKQEVLTWKSLTCDLYMTPASFSDFMKAKEFWRWTASVHENVHMISLISLREHQETNQETTKYRVYYVELTISSCVNDQ